MKVPLLDLNAQYQPIRDELLAAVTEVFDTQQFILGPKVAECEKAVAEYCGCLHACGVSSGTDALLLALMCEGIGPGDAVVTSPYTFFATAGSIARVGAVPIFIDIDPVTYNLDPAKLTDFIATNCHKHDDTLTISHSCELVSIRGSSVRAIMPVHLYGQAADMDPILAIAKEHNLIVIEDACQAIGAEYKGRRAGSLGDYGCFSFYPSKNLNGAGDGGMVVTNDAARAEKLRMMRVHGETSRYHHRWVGGNFRFDAIQAAVITTKLAHLDGWTAARQANAERYGKLFQEAGLIGTGILSLPEVKTTRHVFNQYVVRVAPRDALKDFLAAKDIGTAIYYPVPLHRQECFAYLGYREGDLPESEKAARETLALPVYPELTAEQARHVVAAVGALDQPS
ncbi:MAG: DegT/DnrJ/EryC1/StrS family aminotransferase [Kiritimatiellae bacterium]|nr:DegT/DnrJ/EryC1/StrS family aminotransferase [Kiritimatiellia bacterium]